MLTNLESEVRNRMYCILNPEDLSRKTATKRKRKRKRKEKPYSSDLNVH